MNKTPSNQVLAKKSINVGSKSFSLASIFFNSATKQSAYLLYHWCRYCDDAIDELPIPTIENKQLQWDELYRLTQIAVQEIETPPVNAEFELPPAFLSLKSLIQKYNLPKEIIFDFLQGMKSDIHHTQFSNIAQLEHYCYQVAGTVGILMTHIMIPQFSKYPPLQRRKILDSANYLGKAMQLTNISRDYQEDLKKERIYVPNILSTTPPLQVYQEILSLLGLAQKFYHKGYLGLYHLPFRARLAVAIAGEIYRHIGVKIIKAGPQAIKSRTILNFSEKLKATLSGIFVFALNSLFPFFQYKNKTIKTKES